MQPNESLATTGDELAKAARRMEYERKRRFEMAKSNARLNSVVTGLRRDLHSSEKLIASLRAQLVRECTATLECTETIARLRYELAELSAKLSKREDSNA